jgi:hypothetical protein
MGPLSADTAIGMTLGLGVEIVGSLMQWLWGGYLAATLLEKPQT